MGFFPKWLKQAFDDFFYQPPKKTIERTFDEETFSIENSISRIDFIMNCITNRDYNEFEKNIDHNVVFFSIYCTRTKDKEDLNNVIKNIMNIIRSLKNKIERNLDSKEEISSLIDQRTALIRIRDGKPKLKIV